MGGDILESPVLVLNRNYQPIRVIQAKRAFLLLFSGSARALDRNYEPYELDAWLRRTPEEGEDDLRTSSGHIVTPRVVLLSRYGRVPRKSVRLSRRNIFLRDDYTCQYCAKQLPVAQLNLDHVRPRSRGGPATWENLVTSCKVCNLNKGAATPDEKGMPLLKEPVQPRWSNLRLLANLPKHQVAKHYPIWEPFFGKNLAA